MDSIGKSINGISVVEWLGSKCAVHKAAGKEGVTVSNMHIRLNNPNKFFARVVEVKLDLVG